MMRLEHADLRILDEVAALMSVGVGPGRSEIATRVGETEGVTRTRLERLVKDGLLVNLGHRGPKGGYRLIGDAWFRYLLHSRRDARQKVADGQPLRLESLAWLLLANVSVEGALRAVAELTHNLRRIVSNRRVAAALAEYADSVTDFPGMHNLFWAHDLFEALRSDVPAISRLQQPPQPAVRLARRAVKKVLPEHVWNETLMCPFTEWVWSAEEIAAWLRISPCLSLAVGDSRERPPEGLRFGLIDPTRRGDLAAFVEALESALEHAAQDRTKPDSLEALRHQFDQRLSVLNAADAAARFEDIMDGPADLGGTVKAGKAF